MSYNYNANQPPAGQGGPAAPMFSQAGIQDVVNSWIGALTRPSVQTFAAEVPRATQNRLIISVGLATAVAVVFALIGGLLSRSLVSSVLFALIGTPLGFLIGQGVIYLIAKAVGGTGNFQEQAYVMSTFWAPLLIVQHIPIIGAFIGFIAGLYSLYLTYLALQPTHRLDSSKALMVVGILLAIGLVLAVCAFIFGAAAFMSLIAASNGTR